MANISVYVRIRPMIESEISSHQEQEHRFRIDSSNKTISMELSEKRQKVFRFNKVFNQNTTQQQLYQGLDLPSLVDKVLDGYHSTIFAYGQTGSGKTFTIQGGSNQDAGLIPRVFQQIFAEMQRRNNTQRVYKIILSYVQIYNEGIYDLIDVNGKPLKMRWNKHQQFTVENLFEVQCRSREDAMRWWSKGQKNKVMGSHKMNMNSSRSHCLLTLRVTSYDIQDPSDILQSKFEIVDLAGSERQKVTKSTGAVFRQGIEINKSLFTLRQVIASLYDISQGDNSNKHIPYRDSKLTSLLKQSIGGNTFCSMIACLNPTSMHFQESLQTLTYASMASFINNAPSKNIDPKIRQNEQLRQQNQQYRKQIKKMAQHIEQLTKMLEAGACLSCKNGQNQGIRQSKNYTQTSFTKQIQESQPSGILKLPKFNSKTILTDEPSLQKTISPQNRGPALAQPNKNVTNPSQVKNVPKTEKKTLKTTKDILESITMIKQLINANSGLREKIEILKNMQQKQERQIFSLNKENQVLRERWDMMSDTLGKNQLMYEQPSGHEAPIALYERLLKEQQGFNLSRPGRLYSQNSKTSTSKQQSYNEFLKKNSKQDYFKSKKKQKMAPSIGNARRSERTSSYLRNAQ